MGAALRGAMLADRLRALPFGERDAWIDRELGYGVPPEDGPLPKGAVPYLPCGVDELLAIVDEVGLGERDVVIDLGAGLGRALVVLHLLSGARGRGIEIQPALVAQGRAQIAALGLAAAIELDVGDATEVAIDGEGRVVAFLYAPFGGDLLVRMLTRLEAVARTCELVVCTVGMPLEVAWLDGQTSSVCPALTVYRVRGSQG